METPSKKQKLRTQTQTDVNVFSEAARTVRLFPAYRVRVMAEIKERLGNIPRVLHEELGVGILLGYFMGVPGVVALLDGWEFRSNRFSKPQ